MFFFFFHSSLSSKSNQNRPLATPLPPRANLKATLHPPRSRLAAPSSKLSGEGKRNEMKRNECPVYPSRCTIPLFFAYFLLTPFRRFVPPFRPLGFFLFRLTSLHRHHPASLRYASLLFFQSASLHFAGTALTLSSLTAPVAWGGTSFS